MNIQEMEAGPEMNALAAERVMEWECIQERPLMYKDEFDTLYALDANYNPRTPHQKFYPSTDIAAAWLVHRKACKLPFSKRREYLKQLQDSISERKMPLDYKDIVSRIAWPDVIVFLEPVDFCRAALMVVAKGI